jgi:hypothetical protein
MKKLRLRSGESFSPRQAANKVVVMIENEFCTAPNNSNNKNIG